MVKTSRLPLANVNGYSTAGATLPRTGPLRGQKSVILRQVGLAVVRESSNREPERAPGEAGGPGTLYPGLLKAFAVLAVGPVRFVGEGRFLEPWPSVRTSGRKRSMIE